MRAIRLERAMRWHLRSNRADCPPDTATALRAEGSPQLDVAHNFVEPCTVAGEAGWLHRKALRQMGGTGDYPRLARRYSWLVKPRRRRGLFFNGAGRKWMRTSGQDRFIGKNLPRDSSARTGMGGG